MSFMPTAKCHERQATSDRLKGAKWLTRAMSLAGTAYVIYAGATWLKYGHVKPNPKRNTDSLLDEFMPVYEVADCHVVHVFAPEETAFKAASGMDLFGSRFVHGIFKLRELILGAKSGDQRPAGGLVAEARALGWGVLTEVPDQEVVMGAVTRPWEAEVVFRSVPAEEFAAFHEPEYVKIAWTLRTKPLNETESLLLTETRASTTDASARAKFRFYWSVFSPGIILIRKVLLRTAKSKAERLWQSRSSAKITTNTINRQCT
jgi:hypothetical protein